MVDDAISHRFFDTVDKAIGFGGPAADRDTFDKIAAHAIRLIEDAMTLFRASSFGSAVFLAVTSMEEVAKAEISIYRRKPRKKGEALRSDPLFSHKSKHVISVRPTTFMSPLPSLIGQEACDRLLRHAQNGKLIRLRESGIYSELGTTRTTTPEDAITRERAREIILLAVSVGQDVLVGYTRYSNVYEAALQRSFDELASEFNVEA